MTDAKFKVGDLAMTDFEDMREAPELVLVMEVQPRRNCVQYLGQYHCDGSLGIFDEWQLQKVN